jgi:hypothetical protein
MFEPIDTISVSAKEKQLKANQKQIELLQKKQNDSFIVFFETCLQYRKHAQRYSTDEDIRVNGAMYSLFISNQNDKDLTVVIKKEMQRESPYQPKDKFMWIVISTLLFIKKEKPSVIQFYHETIFSGCYESIWNSTKTLYRVENVKFQTPYLSEIEDIHEYCKVKITEAIEEKLHKSEEELALKQIMFEEHL